MKKIYRKLLQEQRDRGVYFSSTLSKTKEEDGSSDRHEIMHGDPDAERRIALLKNDKFFEDSPWKYNIIRQD